MPSRKHIVVVQDLASRFPAGKIVTSTKASSVIPALTDIYDNYGNPEQQLSDNGTPFNSNAMNSFCRERNIEMAKIPPLHLSANPAETFMKSIRKSMKIAHHNNTSEKKVLAQLLSNYRDTPHPSTGVTPNDMLFPQSVFPRKDITEQTIKTAQKRDELLKQGRTDKVNSTKYRKLSTFEIGDRVLIRNFTKTSKYDPYFLCDPLEIIDIANGGCRLTLKRISNGKLYQRHPDDVKLFYNPYIYIMIVKISVITMTMKNSC